MHSGVSHARFPADAAIPPLAPRTHTHTHITDCTMEGALSEHDKLAIVRHLILSSPDAELSVVLQGACAVRVCVCVCVHAHARVVCVCVRAQRVGLRACVLAAAAELACVRACVHACVRVGVFDRAGKCAPMCASPHVPHLHSDRSIQLHSTPSSPQPRQQRLPSQGSTPILAATRRTPPRSR